MPSNSFKTIRFLALAGGASIALAACTTVPGSNVAAGSPITAAEAAQGKEYHPQFLAEFGGAMTGSQAAYGEQIGTNGAGQGGRGKNRAD